jgi:hypothetical protein
MVSDITNFLFCCNFNFLSYIAMFFMFSFFLIYIVSHIEIFKTYFNGKLKMDLKN